MPSCTLPPRPSLRYVPHRFSKVAVVNRHSGSTYWCMTMRVANVRKHQILKPSIRLIVTAIDSINPSNYV